MKIYFTAAISQLEDFEKSYRKIVETLEKAGHKVQSDHILGQSFDKISNEADEEKVKYYKAFLKRVNTSDVLVAEASFPSTVNIGHEISIALEKEKPVVVLYKKGKSPIFLEGINSEKLFIATFQKMLIK